MTKYYFLLTLSTVLLVSTSRAQNASDALRYSMTNTLSTARGVGVGGSMSAIGADLSTLSLNPAGIAAYRSSEFVISPALFTNKTKSTLTGSGSTEEDNINAFLLSNMGFVIASRPRSARWTTSNFAIGLNKVADYHQKFTYSGSTMGSIVNRFQELADGLPPESLDDFEGYPAYQTSAIYDADEDYIYETDFDLAPDALVYKSQVVEADGFNTELLFAYGANYNEKLLLGFNVGIPILSYDLEKVYREDDESEDLVPFFDRLRFDEYLSTSGSGFNFKLGTIYKFTNFISLGASYQSPTWYSLTDNWSTALEYRYTDADGSEILETSSPDGAFNYNLRTPWAVTGSLGAVFPKIGFLSAEVQYKDFSRANFDYTNRNGSIFTGAENEVNGSIEEQLSSTWRISVGGELALNSLRVRGGVSLQQSPFVDDNAFDETMSAGLGWRGRRVFVDLGFQYFTEDQGYRPYSVNSGNLSLVENDVRNMRFILTVGYKWL